MSKHPVLYERKFKTFPGCLKSAITLVELLTLPSDECKSKFKETIEKYSSKSGDYLLLVDHDNLDVRINITRRNDKGGLVVAEWYINDSFANVMVLEDIKDVSD